MAKKTKIDLGEQSDGYAEQLKVSTTETGIRLEFKSEHPEEDISIDNYALNEWVADLDEDTALRLAEVILKKCRKGREGAY